MDGAATRMSAATRAGVSFAAEAWRDAWAPLGLIVIGQAVAFVAARLDVAPALAQRLQLGGWAVSLAALVPALGALYRSAVGGPAYRRIGWGGLQVGRVEVGVLLVAAGLAVGAAVAGGVLLMAGAAVWLPLRSLGVVRVPLIGPFSAWFLAALPVLLGLGWIALTALGAAALALPAAAGERRPDIGRLLRGSRRWRGSLAATALLLEIAPLLGVLGLVQGLGWLERGQAPGALGGGTWPLGDALAAAVALPFLWAFLLLPVGVGARTFFYGRLLAEDRAALRRRDQHLAPEPLLTPSLAEPSAEPKAIDAETTTPPDAPPRGDPAPAEPAGETAAEAEVEAPDDAIQAESEVVDADEATQIPQPESQPAPAPKVAAARWTPPVPPVRGGDLAQPVTTPVLLAHANDRGPLPWFIPPEHPEGPTVA